MWYDLWTLQISHTQLMSACITLGNLLNKFEGVKNNTIFFK